MFFHLIRFFRGGRAAAAPAASAPPTLHESIETLQGPYIDREGLMNFLNDIYGLRGYQAKVLKILKVH